MPSPCAAGPEIRPARADPPGRRCRDRRAPAHHARARCRRGSRPPSAPDCGCRSSRATAPRHRRRPRLRTVPLTRCWRRCRMHLGRRSVARFRPRPFNPPLGYRLVPKTARAVVTQKSYEGGWRRSCNRADSSRAGGTVMQIGATHLASCQSALDRDPGSASKRHHPIPTPQ